MYGHSCSVPTPCNKYRICTISTVHSCYVILNATSREHFDGLVEGKMEQRFIQPLFSEIEMVENDYNRHANEVRCQDKKTKPPFQMGALVTW